MPKGKAKLEAEAKAKAEAAKAKVAEKARVAELEAALQPQEPELPLVQSRSIKQTLKARMERRNEGEASELEDEQALLSRHSNLENWNKKLSMLLSREAKEIKLLEGLIMKICSDITRVSKESSTALLGMAYIAKSTLRLAENKLDKLPVIQKGQAEVLLNSGVDHEKHIANINAQTAKNSADVAFAYFKLAQATDAVHGQKLTLHKTMVKGYLAKSMELLVETFKLLVPGNNYAPIQEMLSGNDSALKKAILPKPPASAAASSDEDGNLLDGMSQDSIPILAKAFNTFSEIQSLKEEFSSALLWAQAAQMLQPQDILGFANAANIYRCLIEQSLISVKHFKEQKILNLLQGGIDSIAQIAKIDPNFPSIESSRKFFVKLAANYGIKITDSVMIARQEIASNSHRASAAATQEQVRAVAERVRAEERRVAELERAKLERAKKDAETKAAAEEAQRQELEAEKARLIEEKTAAEDKAAIEASLRAQAEAKRDEARAEAKEIQFSAQSELAALAKQKEKQGVYIKDLQKYINEFSDKSSKKSQHIFNTNLPSN